MGALEAGFVFQFAFGGPVGTAPGCCVGFPKSGPAGFGCKKRKVHNNTGVGYGGAVTTRNGGTPVRTIRVELA